MKEIIKTFFESFQQGLNATNYRHEDFELIYDLDSIISKSTGIINGLFTYSNLSYAPQLLNELYFFPHIEEYSDCQVFASSLNGYDYALQKKSGEVCIVDSDTKIYFFSIAESEISFIKVLIKMIEFTMHIIEKREMSPIISKEARNECIRLAGGGEYSKLYRFIIISKGDIPTEKFTLP